MANKISLSQSEDQRCAAPPHAHSDRGPEEERRTSEIELQMREALLLWLRWNTAYEQATERLYEAGPSPEKIEDLLDWLDQLRGEAIKVSREILDG